MLSALWPATTHAGVIFLPGRLTEGKFVANPELKGPFYTIQYSTVTAGVKDGVAQVKLEETIVGPENPIDVDCLIPLPKGPTAGKLSFRRARPPATAYRYGLPDSYPPPQHSGSTRPRPVAWTTWRSWPSAAGRP